MKKEVIQFFIRPLLITFPLLPSSLFISPLFSSSFSLLTLSKQMPSSSPPKLSYFHTHHFHSFILLPDALGSFPFHGGLNVPMIGYFSIKVNHCLIVLRGASIFGKESVLALRSCRTRKNKLVLKTFRMLLYYPALHRVPSHKVSFTVIDNFDDEHLYLCKEPGRSYKQRTQYNNEKRRICLLILKTQ